MRKLAEFPEVVEVAAAQLAPHKLTRYAEDLAASFHQFYTQCRVVDPDEPELTSARLYAVDATRIVLATVLGARGSERSRADVGADRGDRDPAREANRVC